MDPNAALARFREALSQHHQTSATDDDSAFWWHAAEALLAAEALDRWLSAGGFLPDAWEAVDRVDSEDLAEGERLIGE